jgi:type II secretory pathway component PulF
MPAALQQGTSLAKAFEQVAVVSPFVINTVAVGEEGGKAGEALLEIANFYEREVERLLGVAAALLEPVMVLAVGAIVGWIVMAVMLPIFELGSII